MQFLISGHFYCWKMEPSLEASSTSFLFTLINHSVCFKLFNLNMWTIFFKFFIVFKNEHVITKVVADYHDNYARFSLFWNSAMTCFYKLHNIQYVLHGIWMTKLQVLYVEDGPSKPLFGRVKFLNLMWLCWEMCPYTSLPSQGL